MEQASKTIREMGLDPAQVALLHRLAAQGPGYHQDPNRHAGTVLARLGLADDFDSWTFGCNLFAVTPRGCWVAAALAIQKV